MHRLELVGETLHHALNMLATLVPEWLRQISPAIWFERYSKHFQDFRLPDEEEERDKLALEIGRDGLLLYQVILDSPSMSYLRFLPAIETLRQVWLQQYYLEGNEMYWRERQNLQMPPAGKTLNSPYDVEARYYFKRDVAWVGYKVHLSESCEPDYPHIITHVETTAVDVHDHQALAEIHAQLAEKQLLPPVHYVDAGYIEAKSLYESYARYGVQLFGPARPDPSWQGRAEQGFEAIQFQVDWQARRMICPEGKSSYPPRSSIDAAGRPMLKFSFREADCRPCPVHDLCTHANSRRITILDQPYYESFRAARLREKQADFHQEYGHRHGVEGAISQAVEALHMRRSRYRGMPKTRLHHLAQR